MNFFSDVYKSRLIWKWILFAVGFVILFVSLLYVNRIIRQIAKDERHKIQLWTEAIQRKAFLVKYSSAFFEKVELEERKRVELWADAMNKIINADFNEDLSFYAKIVTQNTSIPVIVTDENYNIITSANFNYDKEKVKVLSDTGIFADFFCYPPIEIRDLSGKKIQNLIFYQESVIFKELRNVLDNLINAFFSEIVLNNPGVPVIVTDSTETKIFSVGNIDTTKIHDTIWLRNKIKSMKASNPPIEIKFHGYEKRLVFYEDSYILTQLRYYPLIFFSIIAVFFVAAYVLFSISRKSEQNQVWVGMAKETAHQLGTPISSMMAWTEIMRNKWGNDELIDEINKDIERLQIITERFSKIGSKPVLEVKNIKEVIENSVNYIKTRLPKKINIEIISPDDDCYIPINENLFSWVVENLCKNAVDAMEGKGTIIITIEKLAKEKAVAIDFTDTGKGISKSKFRRIFEPGYTTKKRGWGLGLTIAKRIIENYHKGRIFIKSSSPGKGTTFRVVLRK